MLDFYEIVLIDGSGAPPEVHGMKSYVAGKADDDPSGIAAFVYEVERVLCIAAADVTSLGVFDEEIRDHFSWARQRINEKYQAMDGEPTPADKSEL